MGRVNAWTPEEDEILRRVYPTGEDCSKYFPKRTQLAIFKRASRLGLDRYAFMAAWSDEEVLFLYEASKTRGIDNIALSLGRTRADVRRKATALGVQLLNERKSASWEGRGDGWSASEMRILRENMDKSPAELKPLFPKRSHSAIQAQLHILSDARKAIWTAEEDGILRRYYPVEGADVVKRLPDRTVQACIGRANKLGLKREDTGWTPMQDDILLKFFPFEGERVVSRLPSKSVTSCVNRARELELTRGFGWAKVEDEVLCKYFPKEGANVAMRLPRRTISACLNRAYELKLTPSCKVPWSDEEKVIMLRYYPVEGVDVALRLPGRTVQAIRRMASVLGLRRDDK